MIALKSGALAFLLVAGAPGCARFHRVEPVPVPRQRLMVAVAELDSGRYAPATQQLMALSQEYGDDPVGRQALLTAAAAEVDPRNPDRHLDNGAALLARYLRRSGPDDWVQPQAESLYLLALELGGAADRAEQAEAEAARARAEADRFRRVLPRLPGAPVTARIEDLARDRDRLAARVKELEGSTAGLQKELADTVQELRRIRRTLRP